jgi:integrase/recombinase XerD
VFFSRLQQYCDTVVPKITENTGIMPRIKSHSVTAFNVHDRLVELWLHGKSPQTQEYYRFAAHSLLAFASKPLHLVTLADVQGWQLTLRGLAPSTQRTRVAAVKSLLTFGNKIGVLSVNVGAPVTPPQAADTLNERLLSEQEVQAMIDLETNPRNRLILRLLYSGGLRASELCTLNWKQLSARGYSGQVTVFGKGGKTRTVLLPDSVWVELCQLRGDASATDPVFPSREVDEDGRHLDRTQVYRIVAAAADRAGIPGKVSPHWLRHAHASHALDRGAPIHLVQQTLGHASVATTSRYLHARPNDSSALYLPHA